MGLDGGIKATTLGVGLVTFGCVVAQKTPRYGKVATRVGKLTAGLGVIFGIGMGSFGTYAIVINGIYMPLWDLKVVVDAIRDSVILTTVSGIGLAVLTKNKAKIK